MFRLGSLVFLLASACAHQPPTVKASQDVLGRAYDEVASGTKQQAKAGGYVVKKGGEGDVRVMREGPSGGVATDVTDAWIAAKVKDKVAGVQVRSDGGLVTLRGNVASRDQAMKAVRESLDTDGVTAVRSELQFPGQMRASVPTTRF
jgi:osmotically-inducible protein OsmY